MPRDRDYRDKDKRKRSRSPRQRSSSSSKDKERGKKDKHEPKSEVKQPDSNVETEAQKLKLQEEKARKRKEAWLKLKAESESTLTNNQPANDASNQQQIQPPVVNNPIPPKPELAEDLKSSIQKSHMDKQMLQEDMALDEPIDSSVSEIVTPSHNSDEVDPLDLFMADIHTQMKQEQPVDKGLGHRYHSDEEEDIDTNIADSDEEIVDKDDGEEEGDLVASLQKSGKKNLPQVDHSKITYIPFRKSFYNEPPDLARMTKEEVKALRDKMNGIRVRGKGCPKPAQSFAQCGLSDKILALLDKYGYDKPTSIQAQSIPAVMSGRDIIGIAKTGSGKTLSFLLPMLRHILDQPPIRAGDGPIGLVICPTRELCMQTHAEAKKFCKYLDMNCLAIYGGSGIKSQFADLKRGAEVVVCTPGRMIDVLCANGGKITNLQRVTFLVLDEADRMFDMGFEPQIMKIIGNIRPDKQCVLFSATFPRQVEIMARKILINPLEIVVGGISVVCDDVMQIVEVIDENSKFKRLQDLLKEWQDKGNILIFTDRQESVDRLYTELCYAGFQHNVLALHGGKEQEDRDFTIDDFKRQVKNIMIATSVAARGLDVKDLNLVVNYDTPNHMEDYVHRVGRTGRAGNKGTAITFVTPEEERFAPDIVRALEKSNVPVPPKLKEVVDSYNSKRQQGVLVAVASSGYGGKGYKFDEAEAAKREMARKAAKRALGYDDDDEEEEEPNVVFDEDGEPIYETSVDNPDKKIDVTPLPAVDGKTPAAQQAAQQILGSKPSAFVAANPKLAAQIVREKLLSSSPMLQKMMYGPDHFVEEVEINDFPQQARWKVTHKDALSAITEFTGAAITTRGTYVPPGRNAPLGERKLYLVIEGPTVKSVKTAKQEINRILSEAAAASGPERALYGKYSVL